MEILEAIQSGAEWVRETVGKLQKKEDREASAREAVERLKKAGEASAKTAEQLKKTAGESAQAAAELLKEQKDRIDEMHLTPGAKEKYIRELELQLAARDSKLRSLRKMTDKKNWTGNCRGYRKFHEI